MKKIMFAALALMTSMAFAGSVTFEAQDQQGDKGAKDSRNYQLSVKENINKNFAGDVGFTNYQQVDTNILSTRLEAGLTGSFPVGPVGVYTRVALGEKDTNGSNFTYYSVEPGVTYTFDKFTVKAGYRYRTATNHPNVYKDTTDTGRLGLSYALTKHDSIGVRYDRTIGDSTNHSYNLNYTRSF